MVDTVKGTYKMEIPRMSATRRLTEDAKETIKERSIKRTWRRRKGKNGQYVRNVGGKFIAEKRTIVSLRNRQLKRQTKHQMIGTQGEALDDILNVTKVPETTHCSTHNVPAILEGNRTHNIATSSSNQGRVHKAARCNRCSSVFKYHKASRSESGCTNSKVYR